MMQDFPTGSLADRFIHVFLTCSESVADRYLEKVQLNGICSNFNYIAWSLRLFKKRSNNYQFVVKSARHPRTLEDEVQVEVKKLHVFRCK
jgi:hypothetical protein